MKKFTLPFSAILVLFLCSFSVQAQTVDEIVDTYFENIGGKDAWRKIKSMQIEGNGVQMGMKFPLVVSAKYPNLSKFEVDIQGKKIVEAFDGTNAWALNPFAGSMDPTLKTEEETKEAATQMFEDELLDYKDKGHTLTLEGKEEIDGTETFKVKMVKKDGDERYYFFDTENFVPIMLRSYGKSGQMKGQTIETVSSDFQEVDGVMVPFSMEQRMGGQTLFQMEATTVKLNVDMDDAIFAFPSK